MITAPRASGVGSPLAAARVGLPAASDPVQQLSPHAAARRSLAARAQRERRLALRGTEVEKLDPVGGARPVEVAEAGARSLPARLGSVLLAGALAAARDGGA